MQSIVFEPTSTKFIYLFIYLFLFHKNNFFIGKNVTETILAAINDSSDMLCFDLYLIKIFVKSTKAKRCTNVVFKLTLYCQGWK